jgi:hypothetical protein
LTPSLTGRQGASYELRVVAADRQRNRSVSEKRIVTLPLDDAHSAFASSYSGMWSEEAGLSGYYAGTRRSTSDPAAEFVKLFDGTRVAWVAPTGAAFGTAEVSIDGAVVESVDLSAPEAVRAVVFDLDGLAPGAHTIAIRRTSGTIAVDGIAVR